MKKITKLLLASTLAFSACSAIMFFSNDVKQEEQVAFAEDDITNADNVIYFKIDGTIYKQPGLTKISGKGWTYNSQDGNINLFLDRYNGGSIHFEANDTIVNIYVTGSSTVTADDETSYGISSNSSLRFIMDRGENLTVNSTATCIISTKKEVLFFGDGTNFLSCVYLNSSDGNCVKSVGSTRVSSGAHIFANSKHSCFDAPHYTSNYYPSNLSTWQYNYNAGELVTDFYVSDGGAVYGVSEEDPVFTRFEYADWRKIVLDDEEARTGRSYFGFYRIGDFFEYTSQDKIYTSRDCKVMSVAAKPDELFSGFLDTCDETPRMSRYFYNSSSLFPVPYRINEPITFSFNSKPLPSQLIEKGFIVERSYELVKNGESNPLYSVSNNTSNDALSFTHTFTDLSHFIYRRVLQLYKNAQDSNPVATIEQKFGVNPYTHHTVSLDPSVKGYTLRDVAGQQTAVRTGSDYKFKLTLNSNYIEQDDVQVFANNQELTATDSGVYTISNVRENIVIDVIGAPKYRTIVNVYVSDTLIHSQFVTQGTTYTLPTLSTNQIPEGTTFDYWKVGERSNHYNAGTAISFAESERGEIRIDAHFTGLYNLTITDGHFYSDSGCTQIISQAAKNSTVYFKFDSEPDVIVDGKMLYSYELQCETTGVQIYYMDGYWQMYMPGNDVSITPIYKYIVNELTAENVVVPVAGEPLIERSITAPSDADYIISESSNWCYKVVGDTKTSVYTYDNNNPYIFENNTTYEFEFQFRIPSGANYLLHPDGYLRDGGCQITIDGLNDSDYEIVSANFTNSYKEYYKVTLRMNVVNRYELTITNGVAYIGEEQVGIAKTGDEIVLVADRPEVGKNFDKWIVTGLTLTEDELSNSRLAITMPDSEVIATATYKDTPTYQVSFNANGGTGIMSDDTTYGEYYLPSCTFTAPENKVFKCWKVNGEEYSVGSLVLITENTEIDAVWAYEQYLVVFSSGEAGSETSGSYVDYGTVLALPSCTFAAPEGKEFAGWQVGSESTLRQPGDEITISGEITITAQWKDVDTPVDPEKPSKGGLPAGAIVGIILGSVALVGVAIFFIIKFAGKKK